MTYLHGTLSSASFRALQQTSSLFILFAVVSGGIGFADDGRQSSASQPSTGITSSYVFPSADERFRRYLQRSIGISGLMTPAIQAAVDQSNNTPEEWGQGAEGYGKRYESRFAFNLVTETTRYGLSEAFRMDSGYKKCNCKGFLPRFGHALRESVIARRPDGGIVPDVPTFISPYAGAMTAVHSWYPDRFGWKDGLRLGTIQLAVEPTRNLFREFFPKLFR